MPSVQAVPGGAKVWKTHVPPALQAPDAHPFVQKVPLAAFVNPQVLLLQVRCWQGFDGCGQSEAWMQPTQVPDWHTPPEHVVPSAFAGFEHWPVPGSQTPAEWQSSSGWQTTALPATQVPL